MLDWDNRGGAAEQEEEDEPDEFDAYAAPLASDAFVWREDGTKKRRLRGKTTTQPAVEEPQFDLDAAFGDMLDATLEAAVPDAEQSKGDAAVPQIKMAPKSGLRVVLHSLNAKPELNGKFARLRNFIEETGRWEVIFEAGAACDRANVKPTNFTVLPAVQQAAAPTYRPARRLTGKTSMASLNGKRPVAAAALATDPAPNKPVRRRVSTASLTSVETAVTPTAAAAADDDDSD